MHAETYPGAPFLSASRTAASKERRRLPTDRNAQHDVAGGRVLTGSAANKDGNLRADHFLNRDGASEELEGYTSGAECEAYAEHDECGVLHKGPSACPFSGSCGAAASSSSLNTANLTTDTHTVSNDFVLDVLVEDDEMVGDIGQTPCSSVAPIGRRRAHSRAVL